MSRFLRLSVLMLVGMIGAAAAQGADPNDFLVWNYYAGGQGDQTVDCYGRLYVPEDYDSQQSYPLVIFFHGLGEKGYDNTSQVNSNIDNLYAECVDREVFLYAPQSGGGWWPDWLVGYVMAKVDETTSTYNIDTSCIYVTGLSAGGQGVYNALEVYGNELAAGVGICAAAGTTPRDRDDELVGKPLWLFHAVNDSQVSVYQSRGTINGIRDEDGGKDPLTFPLDNNSSNPYYNTGEPYYSDGTTFYSENNLRYTEYDTGDHGIWGRVYGEEWMYDWLFAQSLGGSPTNDAPSVDAGSNQSITLPTNQVSLDGTVSDDGLPDPPAAVTVAWTKTSGPGTVTFGDDEAVDTTASFSAAGTYVLRLTADDGDLDAYDEVTITVNEAASGGSEDILTPIGAGSCAGYYFPMQGAFDGQPTWDDENTEPIGTGGGSSGAPYYASRFGYIDFGTGWADVRITQTWTLYFAYSPGDQSGYASAWWDDDIDGTNDDGVTESTLDFNSAQDMANSSSRLWVQDVDCSASPVAPQRRYLILGSPANMTSRAVEYAIIGYVGGNEAPSVDAGQDAQVFLSGSVSLDGTVSDDGLPDPPASVTVTWTQQSGPGTATLGNTSAVDTTASFSAAGTYVLRLTADDGDLDAYDEVTITVVSEDLIAPTAAGSCTGYYFPMQGAFDGQPTWDGSAPAGTGGGSSGAPYYASRFGYIDFGADWANVHITQTWTLYFAYSPGDQSGYASAWWDDDIDGTNDDGVAESTLDFNSAQDMTNSSSRLWIQDVDCSASPVAPQRRYLILGSPASMTSRAVEYAIVGYTTTP